MKHNREMTVRKIQLLLLVFLLGLSSCTRDEWGKNIPEGEPTLVNLRVGMAQMGNAQTRAMTPVQESTISKLHIMIFDGEGKLLSNHKFINYDAAVGVQLTTLSGINRQIFVVANATDPTDAALDRYGTLAEVQAETLFYTNPIAGLSGATSLMMTGLKTGVSIPKGNASTKIEDIKMEFAVAKVNLTLKDGTDKTKGEKVTFLGYDLIDVPKENYLLPNSAADSNGTPTNIADNGKWFSTLSATESKPALVNNSLSLYLLENRRGGRAAKPAPPTGIHTGAEAYRDKKHYAPARATYFKIYALFESKSSIQRIDIYVCLGGNNSDNYDVKHGCIYNFTVTIKSINNIGIDSNVDSPVSLSVQVGSAQFDTHYDGHLVSLTSTVKGTAIIEFVNENGGIASSWLTVSPLNLFAFQVKGFPFQQTDESSKLVRPKYQLATGAKTLTEAVANRFVCDKITGIELLPLPSGGKTLYMYAAENLSEEARIAYLKVTFTPEGGDEISKSVVMKELNQAGYINIFNGNGGIKTLNQRGLIDRNSTQRKFVIERTEEYLVTLSPPEVSQKRDGMKWGWNGEWVNNVADRDRNGIYATASAVLTGVSRNIDEHPQYDVFNYRKKLGADGTAINEVSIPYDANTTTNPFHYPNDPFFYHSIYNISPARYCFEKNQDLNGDGEISSNELFWYLPSEDELLLILISGTELNQDKNLYHCSSTEASASEIRMVDFTGAGIPVQTIVKTFNSRVRCIRKI